MYIRARRSVVPLWRRIQVTSLASTSVVTNWRSWSLRWAMLTIAQRGLPSGVCSIEAMSSGGPVIHAANDGDASRPLRRIAKSIRSFGGKNESSSNTPSLRTGGVWIMPISEARSRLRPAVHSLRMMLDTRMCSRLVSGSASMPTRPSSPLTNPSISSPTISASFDAAGGWSEPTMLIPIPADEPGV